MNNLNSRGLWWSAALLAVVAGSVLPGCQGRAARREARMQAAAARAMQSSLVMLDGRPDEWPPTAAVQADANWVYFRVSVEGGTAPLQAAPETTALWLDADGSAKTGAKMEAPAEAAGMGVDLVIEYSPRDEASGKTKSGVVAYALDEAGNKTPLTHAQVGLASLPTVASSAYEVRISRHADAAVAPGLARALSGRGSGRSMVVLSDSSGKMVGWSDPESFPMPSAAASAPVADLSIPSKAPGSVRVVSYNVLKSALNENPQSFARVFQVLDPDIIVIQEWDADAATAGSWFTGQVSGERSWNARSAGSGVVIVSPHPMKPLGPNALSLAGAAQQTQVRFIGSVVTTPAGDVAVGSVHLKCCGTAGSSEDQRRLAEAKLINSTFKSALSEGGPAMRVVAGDCNLVGTYGPLEALMAGLDSDGSDVSPATPVVLGDAATYTWSDPKSEFPPGRLDYAVYSDASADVVQAFVLDTSRLSARSLARVGLDRTDTAASDHLPIVVDLRPR